MAEIMILRRLNASIEEKRLSETAWALVQDMGHTPHTDDEVDWAALREQHGGFSGAYEAAAMAFAGFVAIPNVLNGLIAKGQFSIVDAALRLGKPVTVVQDDRLVRVTSLEVTEAADWKEGYARCCP